MVLLFLQNLLVQLFFHLAFSYPMFPIFLNLLVCSIISISELLNNATSKIIFSSQSCTIQDLTSFEDDWACWFAQWTVYHKVCDFCHLAKQQNLPFPSSTTHTHNAFDMINVDIWGPLAITSIHGYSYFLTIVDDYTRHTWVYH
jgi:hypothetical protein